LKLQDESEGDVDVVGEVPVVETRKRRSSPPSTQRLRLHAGRGAAAFRRAADWRDRLAEAASAPARQPWSQMAGQLAHGPGMLGLDRQ
jgi:hypothetical protein